MNVLDSQLYKKDINISLSNVINLEKLKGSKILITGCTGLVCSAVIDMLVTADLDITIYAAGRNESKVRNRFGNFVKFVQYDANEPLIFTMEVDYIIHGASNASPNLYVEEPVETMNANIYGMKNLLDYSRMINTKKVLYISSSEIYGNKNSKGAYKENQYGYIDILNPRSSYPIAKRAAETLCASYFSEFGVVFNIVRLGHIYGPTASKNDKRVSSSFAFDASRGDKLILNSAGNQIRSYCYCLDCASAILTILINGHTCEAYNISNPKSIISIKQMAEYLAIASGTTLEVNDSNEIDVSSFNPMDDSSLDSSKLEALGWHGVFDAFTGLSHTIRILKGE